MSRLLCKFLGHAWQDTSTRKDGRRLLCRRCELYRWGRP